MPPMIMSGRMGPRSKMQNPKMKNLRPTSTTGMRYIMSRMRYIIGHRNQFNHQLGVLSTFQAPA
eukprot:6456594-Prymnesium_polylepis.1